MEWGQQMRKHEQVARDSTYFNTNYTNSRETKIPLIIDITESSGNQLGLSNTGSFSVKLMEPLIIDELSDIYLDNCLTINCKFANSPDDMAFVVKIDQFNINTRSASSGSNNIINTGLLITNEHDNVANHNTLKVHKGKKMNYVCSINPTKLYQLTGTITNLAGTPVFPLLKHYAHIEALVESIPAGTSITLTGGLVGTTAVDHVLGATEFYYYITTLGSVDFTGTPTVTLAGYTNKRILANTNIAGIHPRMIMEFLIVNRT